MSVLRIAERINKDRAEFLLSLDKSLLTELIWNDDISQTNKGEKFIDKKTYVNQVLKMLKLQLANNCELIIDYNYSKKMRTDGRLFSQFGLQGCKKNLRGFLVGNDNSEPIYLDYDMENCHPKILKNLLIEYFFKDDKALFKTEFKWFWAYTSGSTARTAVLKKADCCKSDILEMMNSANVTDLPNAVAQSLDTEFKKIQDIFYNQLPKKLEKYASFKDDNIRNKKGSFLNKLLCIKENELINKVISHFESNYGANSPIFFIIFDGLHIKSSLSSQVNILNEITKDEGATWNIKQFDNSIEKNDLYINRDELPPYKQLDYITIKLEFEKDHFMILEPVMFGSEDTLKGKKIVSTYSKGDFQTLVEPYLFENWTSRGMMETSLFNKWIKDKNRRVYKRFDFIPTFNDDPEVYNTFQGFDYSNYANTEFNHVQGVIDVFIKHIGILVDHDPACVTWVLRYFADIIQNPDIRPDIAIIFKSGSGYGKDLLIDFISELLGDGYLHRTVKLDDVFGQFNGECKNKLIIQFNEMSAKDGFANKESIKNFITQKFTNINEKNRLPYKQSNFVRVIICTNNNSVVDIPADDRRFVVFQSDPKKPKPSYFNDEIRPYLTNKDALFTLYKYLNELDLGGVRLAQDGNRPITSAYKDLQEDCTSPFHVYLNNCLLDYENELTGLYKIHKKTRNLLITSNDLFYSYTESMELQGKPIYKFSQQIMKGMLGAIKVERVKAGVNGDKKWYYKFDVPYTLDLLNDLGLNMDDDCIIFNEEDYE